MLHGINGRANQMYYVLATSNLTMGMFNWERINTGLFDPNGNFAYTNGIASETSSRFYRIEVP